MTTEKHYFTIGQRVTIKTGKYKKRTGVILVKSKDATKYLIDVHQNTIADGCIMEWYWHDEIEVTK